MDFSTKVLNEAIDFMQIAEETLIKFYEPVICKKDLNMIYEDLHKLIVSLILKDEVYKIVLILMRI